MKLTAYIINGIPVGDIIAPWVTTEPNEPTPFKVEDTVSDGYMDISSISNWIKFSDFTDKDFLFIRKEILLLLNNLGFQNLNLEEKQTVSKLFLVGKSDRDTVLTEEEQKDAWAYLIISSKESREKRWNHAKEYISYKLSPQDSSNLALSTSVLSNDYINYNIITKVKDGVSGLFDYLKGEGDYLGAGYPLKSYWTQQDQDKIMDILDNGNY